MAGIGASFSLPFAPAEGGLPKRQRPLSFSGGNAFSCRRAVICKFVGEPVGAVANRGLPAAQTPVKSFLGSYIMTVGKRPRGT